jgi:S-adenosyl methyltransferase
VDCHWLLGIRQTGVGIDHRRRVRYRVRCGRRGPATKGVDVNRPTWVPSGVDIDQPSIARVYDYFLGGSHNFAADRAFGDRLIAAVPDTVAVVRENRAFLRRAVRFIASQGVDQFIDVGSGIPTVGNVHEVAASVVSSPRVVYVDNDPVAIAHGKAILADVENASILGADMLRTPILEHPDLRAVIDLDRPVGVLFAAVLHFVPDDAEAAGLVAALASGVAPGSYVAISHAADDVFADEGKQVQGMYSRAVATLALRSRAAFTALFGDLELVEPGVVQVPRWRPDPGEDTDRPYPGYAAVGRVR